MRAAINRIEVTPRQFEWLAWAALIALTLIVFTGAAVRLTGSGLGCPNWPRCYGHVYPPLQTHALIEFSNRAVSALVGVVVVIAAALAWRRRPFRRDLALIALSLPAGVVAQAVLGGYTVEEKLAPGFVMAHFGLSMVILIGASALVWRARVGPGPARAPADPVTTWAVRLLAPLAAIVIVAGTATTAAGPHSGGAVGQHIKRLDFDGANTLNVMVHIHGALAFALGIAAVLVWVLAERRQADPGLRRALSWLCVLIAFQGVIGAVQYETHLPTELVWVHVAAASLCWLCVLWAAAACGRPAPVQEGERAQVRPSILARNP